MKARIKATGEIVELAPYTRVCEDFAKGRSWLVEELDDADDVTDYWTRLEHQYAGMAMQGIMMTHALSDVKQYARLAVDVAHTLVEKMRNTNE